MTPVPIAQMNKKNAFLKVNVSADPNWLGGKSGMVRDFSSIVLRIETTNHCNFRCTFCPHPTHKRERLFINEELFNKIVREAGELGFRTLDIRNFGEPLVDKRLGKLVQEARTYGFENIYIHTNGYGLTKKKLDYLVECGMTMIIVSLSPRKEFEETRPGSKFDRLEMHLNSIRDSANRSKVYVDYIDTNSSSTEEVDDLKKWVADLGVNFRTEITLHNWAHGTLTGDIVRSPCHRLWTSFTVLSNGQVALCCLDYEGEEVLGDLNLNGIEEIINGKRYQDIRLAHLDGEFLPICFNCDMPLVKDQK